MRVHPSDGVIDLIRKLNNLKYQVPVPYQVNPAESMVEASQTYDAKELEDNFDFFQAGEEGVKMQWYGTVATTLHDIVDKEGSSVGCTKRNALFGRGVDNF